MPANKPHISLSGEHCAQCKSWLAILRDICIGLAIKGYSRLVKISGLQGAGLTVPLPDGHSSLTSQVKVSVYALVAPVRQQGLHGSGLVVSVFKQHMPA